MEISNIFNNRDRFFSQLSEAEDYLARTLRQNLTIFDVNNLKSEVVFLSENNNFIKCNYNFEDDKTSLSDFKITPASTVYSDEYVDDAVAGCVTDFVGSLRTSNYDSADNKFENILEMFKFRNQINETRAKIEKKSLIFDSTLKLSSSKQYQKLEDAKPLILKYIKENAETILNNEDIVNSIKLSNAITRGFNTPSRNLEDLEGAILDIPSHDKKSLYEMICFQELVRKELMESKKGFANLWAGNETISRLASCIYSADEVLKRTLAESISEVPYIALSTKADLMSVFAPAYDITNPGTITKKEIKEFVSKIYEFKKPAKTFILKELNDTYGINVQNLKTSPTFSNLCKTQSVFFEVFAKLAKDNALVSDVMADFGTNIKKLGGVAALDVNDFILSLFGDETNKLREAKHDSYVDLNHIAEKVKIYYFDEVGLGAGDDADDDLGDDSEGDNKPKKAKGKGKKSLKDAKDKLEKIKQKVGDEGQDEIESMDDDGAPKEMDPAKKTGEKDVDMDGDEDNVDEKITSDRKKIKAEKKKKAKKGKKGENPFAKKGEEPVTEASKDYDKDDVKTAKSQVRRDNEGEGWLHSDEDPTFKASLNDELAKGTKEGAYKRRTKKKKAKPVKEAIEGTEEMVEDEFAVGGEEPTQEPGMGEGGEMTPEEKEMEEQDLPDAPALSDEEVLELVADLEDVFDAIDFDGIQKEAEEEVSPEPSEEELAIQALADEDAVDVEGDGDAPMPDENV